MRNILSTLAILAALLSTGFTARAQMSYGGEPYSFNHTISQQVETIEIEALDMVKLLEEDAENLGKNHALRIGMTKDVNYDIRNSGRMDLLPNGGRVWRLAFHMADATFTSLNFSTFNIPDGAELYLYTPNREYVIGKFTNKNQMEDGTFYPQELPGEDLVVEYYEPAGVDFEGELVVDQISQGYYDFFHIRTHRGGLGNAEGTCHPNAICYDNTWHAQINSVACYTMTEGPSVYMCSGAMINNTANNGKQYFLSANHCYSGNATYKFYFQYQATTCTGSNGSLIKTATGARVLAKDDGTNSSDFMLLEITGNINPTYDVYLSGWDISTSVPTNPTSCATIHHPGGDIKKLSIPQHIVDGSSAGYSKFWMANWNYETGTTEQGSSGAPLFNATKLIVGQLYAGSSSCVASDQNQGPSGWDLFGKLSNSWENNNNSSNAKKLKPWLDPTNSGATTLQGRWLNASTVETPTVTTSPVTDITSTSATCGGTVTYSGSVGGRGVCWSTSPNPTLEDSYTADGYGTGTFTSELTGLTPSTTYYVRAYAIDTAWTVYYGEEMSFTTEQTAPIIFSEDFSTLTGSGTQQCEASGSNIASSLEDYLPGWTGDKVYPANGKLKLGTSSVNGWIQSPIVDLTMYEYVRISFQAMAYNSSDATYMMVYVNEEPYIISGLRTTAEVDCVPDDFSIIVAANQPVTIRFEGQHRIFLDNIIITPATDPFIEVQGVTNRTDIPVNQEISFTLHLRGYNLTASGTTAIAISGDSQFSTEVSSLSNDNLMAESGVNLPVTFYATEAGNYAATITFSNSDLSNPVTVSLTVSTINIIEVSTIAGLRALIDNSDVNQNYTDPVFYKYTGHAYVTQVSQSGSSNHYKWIQDGTAAIQIYDPYDFLSNVNQGVEITNLVGHLLNYYGYTEFNVTAGIAISDINSFPNNPPEPLTITLEQLRDQTFMDGIQGQLVRMANVTFDQTGTFDRYGIYTVTQGNTSDTAVYVTSNYDTQAGADIPTNACNIIGVNMRAAAYSAGYGTVRLHSRYYILPREFEALHALPSVTTSPVTDITSSTATSGGNVTDDGGATVTARGVCWSTSHNPTLNDSYTTDGSGMGEFTCTLNELVSETIYYVRAYATNSLGTAYGNEFSFSTSCGNVIVEISGNTDLCEGDTATLIATGASTYQWNTGTTGDILQTSAEGTYSVIGTDTNGCWGAASISVTVHTIDPPSLIVDGEISACNESTATLSVEGSYTSYLWSTGDTTPSIEVSMPGYYWINVTDEYGCATTSEDTHLGVSILIPETPTICMVGVENNHNLIVWEVSSNTNVRNYRIYRENDQANVFELLATIPASMTNAYEDTTANPSVRAYRYKVTAMDICQGETPMSEFHKTIHLTINRGIGESWNLIWTPYEGMEFPSYRLYRGTTPDNLELIATIPSNLTTLTDFEAPAGALYYQIEMVMESSCQLHTRDTTAYTGARSNIVYNGEPAIEGISVYTISELHIYPNPTNGIVTLELTPETCTLTTEIQVFDIFGKRLQVISIMGERTQIDLSRYATGVYLIKLVNDGNVIAVGKVVKE